MTAALAKAAAKPAAPPDPRAALRSAIANRDAAQAKLAEATAAGERAAKLVDEAQAALDRFADLGARIAAHHVKNIKRGAKLDPVLPPELAAQRDARREAEDHVTTARAAHDVLAAELATAQREAKAASHAASIAATGVLVEEAAAIAAAIRPARERLWALEDTLQALAQLWVPDRDGALRAVRLPPFDGAP